MESDINVPNIELDPGSGILIGINGDLNVSKIVAEAVERSGRLFPYVVRHIADNRIKSEVDEINSVDSIQCMREVRDELKLCIESLQKNRTKRHQQASNMTANVKSYKQPYFVR